MYQRKTLVPLADVGLPGDLPADLVGLADSSLADLPLAIGVPAATQLGYLNTGFFLVEIPPVPPAGTVYRSQLFIAAWNATLLDDFITAAGTLDFPNQLRFENGTLFHRDQPLWALIGAAAGVSDPVMDGVFAAAALIDP